MSYNLIESYSKILENYVLIGPVKDCYLIFNMGADFFVFILKEDIYINAHTYTP